MKLIIKEKVDKSETIEIITQYLEGIRIRIMKTEDPRYLPNSIDIYIGDKQLTSFYCNDEDASKLKTALKRFADTLEICVKFSEHSGKSLVSLREFPDDK